MNSKPVLAMGAVCLFAVGGMARAQSAPQTAPPSTQPTMQQGQVQAQPGTDTSYGGVQPTGSAAAGSTRPPPCVLRTSCDIYHGH
ncbi:hypothetical protein B0G74_7703 [Paraburkholderia sp. BL9I2N2]|jgi:hypothetical protein|nr:hypothetical protein B0G74_7703 [Paraburkholderia sp. BL9I2N2]